MSRKAPPPLFQSVEPLPPAYDLPTTLRLLGLRHAQHFYSTGLARVVERVSGTPLVVFRADSVQAWSRRVMRLRIMQAEGEVGRRGPRSGLADAPADDSRDTTCPKCGAFALRRADGSGAIRCIHGHVARPRHASVAPPPPTCPNQ